MMLRYRLLASFLAGAAFTIVLFATLSITWIFGITLLTPGIVIAGYLGLSDLTPSPLPMLTANTFVYSLLAVLLLEVRRRWRNT